MAGPITKKRRGDDRSRPQAGRSLKRRKPAKAAAYHSDADSVANSGGDSDDGDFQAVDLADSDDDILNDDALADDGASTDSDDSLDSLDSDDRRPTKGKAGKHGKDVKDSKGGKTTKKTTLRVSDAPASSGDDDDDDEEDEDNQSDADDSDDADAAAHPARSKRNDPGTFATSLQKILGTKLATGRRADPVLARSVDAREASRRGVDAALEDKARRQLRLEKRAAMDKGRVKDVLVATNREAPAGGASTGAGPEENTTTAASLLASERALRKVAQRGVVQLFNAVRAAQVKAAQAQQATRAEGIIGRDKREAKVTEMSRKGFLDLIASGGGGLKKGGLEEA